jgi:hypothetical protein
VDSDREDLRDVSALRKRRLASLPAIERRPKKVSVARTGETEGGFTPLNGNELFYRKCFVLDAPGVGPHSAQE